MMHYKCVCQISIKVTPMTNASAIPQRGNIDFILILIANAVLGAAMPMLIVLGGLAGLMLTPSPALSTLPFSMGMLSGLFAAAPLSWCMGKFGRKLGFILGAILAALGGLMGGAAMIYEQFWLLILAHISLGAALACFQYFRFAAAEVVSEAWQPVAISLVLSSGLFAAFIGPEIFIQTKELLAPMSFAGAYLAIVPLSLVGILPVLFTRFAAVEVKGDSNAPHVSIREVLSRKSVALAVAAASISGGVMVLLMTPTPLAMVACGFTDANASDVIRWHVIAMFAPSFVTGLIIKRFGVTNVIMTGVALLAIAAGLAISGIEIHHFYASLIILGIGWNFGFIGATSLLAASLKPHERAKMQGVNDTCVALAFTFASFSSGVLVTSFSWTVVAISALPVLAVMMLGLMMMRKEVS